MNGGRVDETPGVKIDWRNWALGAMGAVALSAIAWNFSAVQSLQITESKNELSIAMLRSEIDAQRSNESAIIGDMRASMARLEGLLTDLRIKLDGDRRK
jgi:hypothetical protein